MSRTALVTVVTCNYLHYASALASSCQRWLPNHDFFVVLVDSLPSGVNLPDNISYCIFADQIGIENWARFSFQYTPFELACAVKPYAMRYLFNANYTDVIYLDSDIDVYSPLETVRQSLETSSIILTPHLVTPLPNDDRRPTEHLFLSSGIFNAGFVACRASAEGQRFVDWWANRLQSDCFIDLKKGIFVDQKWLDLVPGMFDDVSIIRTPAVNTGHWTLSQFSLTGNHTTDFRVGQDPLECFHFSSLLPTNPNEFFRAQNRVSFESMPSLAELVSGYHKKIKLHDAQNYSSLTCSLTKMTDGTPIKAAWREAIRRNVVDFRDVANPFDVASNPKLVEQFGRIEKKARRWREDWRLATQEQIDKKNKLKKWKNTIKYWLSKFRR
ncbi:MAG: hypothetical protein NTW52_09550 [Planctomycetota bacterium]|nr:hypothetical protein [Planctomycetota bacterium]